MGLNQNESTVHIKSESFGTFAGGIYRSMHDFCSILLVTRLIRNRCYCGNTVAHASIPTPDYSCENVCSGNQQSVCGGTNVLNLYEVDNVATPSLSLISSDSTNSSNSALLAPPAPQASATVAKVKGWTYRGCWTDDRYDRTLISKRFKGSITPKKCAQLCKGYQFFGLEYSNE